MLQNHIRPEQDKGHVHNEHQHKGWSNSDAEIVPCQDVQTLSSLGTGNIDKLRWYPQKARWHPIGTSTPEPPKYVQNVPEPVKLCDCPNLPDPSSTVLPCSLSNAKTCQIPPQPSGTSGDQAFQTPPEPFNSGTLWTRELICASVLVCHSISRIAVGEKNACKEKRLKNEENYAANACSRNSKALTTFWCCDMSKAKQRIF